MTSRNPARDKAVVEAVRPKPPTAPLPADPAPETTRLTRQIQDMAAEGKLSDARIAQALDALSQAVEALAADVAEIKRAVAPPVGR